ncbi:hypothetical protein [Bailinhaonella thermotolerans]|uniref:hypothetical protein n=1 Tax=Bailinhaonella thermotolerans TaxID=1070861 RepID=UPI0011C47AF8|nr:hypothetical protein [Bailinhaonella thermotolerans]
MTTPGHQGYQGEEGIPDRHLHLVAAAIGVIVVVGLVGVIWSLSRRGDPPSVPPAAVSSPAAGPPQAASPPAAQASTAPPPVPSAVPTAAPSPPAVARPVVRWRGEVTVSGLYAHTDLDAVPVRTARGLRGADIVGDWLATSLTATAPGVRLAPASEASPGLDSCRDAVLAGGAEEIARVRTGDVLCAITSEGRVARLRATHAVQTSGRPVVQLAVTVWDPPQAGG